MINRIESQLKEGCKSRLLAVCDFVDIPISYDIVGFIATAEHTRKIKRLDKVDIAFVGHASDPCRINQPNINASNFRHYLHNFGFEIFRLLKSGGAILFFDNRKAFTNFFLMVKDKYVVFPEHYDYLNPVELVGNRVAVYHPSAISTFINSETDLGLHAPKEQTKMVKKWLLENVYPSIPITITLRELNFQLARNSNTEEWQKLIDSYKYSDIKFIILRDYYKLYEPHILVGDNVIYCNEFVTSISLRAALYESCVLNLFNTNGCMTLALFIRSNCIIFKFTAPGSSSSRTATKRIWNLKYGDNWQGATRYQKLVWEPDNFEIMKPQVDSMIDVLKNDGLWRIND